MNSQDNNNFADSRLGQAETLSMTATEVLRRREEKDKEFRETGGGGAVSPKEGDFSIPLGSDAADQSVKDAVLVAGGVLNHAVTKENEGFLGAVPMNIRSYDLLDHEFMSKATVEIIGCGAIGSFLAVNLARMGFRNFILWDGDRVARENIGIQNFTKGDIGWNKATIVGHSLRCVGDNVEVLANDRFFAFEEEGCKERADVTKGNVIFLCVDSIETRRSIMMGLGRRAAFSPPTPEKRIDFICDTRMGATTCNCYAVNGVFVGGIEWIMSTLPPGENDNGGVEGQEGVRHREEVLQEPCTARGTVFYANLAAFCGMNMLFEYMKCDAPKRRKFRKIMLCGAGGVVSM